MKRVIFSENYTSIDTTLYLATRNSHTDPVTIVIPGNYALFKFFQVINERVFHDTLNLIYFEPYRARRATAKGVKKVFHVLPDIIKERRHLKEIYSRYFAELKGYELFFFSRGFSGIKFYLLKKLSKRNTLVYVSHAPPNIPPMSQYTPTNIIDLARLIILKLSYGRDIAIGKFYYMKGLAYMPDRFMEKEVDRVINWDERNEMMKDFDLSRFKVFDVGNYDVLYFGHDIGLDTVADRDMLEKEFTNIFNILTKHFPENRIARKHHPMHNKDKTMVQTGDALPDYIPAEFLYSEKVKVYLSPYSLSIANVPGGTAISILDLIPVNSNKRRNQIKELLIKQSRTEILFPKSLDEFKRILIDIKQQTK